MKRVGFFRMEKNKMTAMLMLMLKKNRKRRKSMEAYEFFSRNGVPKWRI